MTASITVDGKCFANGRSNPKEMRAFLTSLRDKNNRALFDGDDFISAAGSYEEGLGRKFVELREGLSRREANGEGDRRMRTIDIVVDVKRGATVEPNIEASGQNDQVSIVSHEPSVVSDESKLTAESEFEVDKDGKSTGSSLEPSAETLMTMDHFFSYFFCGGAGAAAPVREDDRNDEHPAVQSDRDDSSRDQEMPDVRDEVLVS